MKHNPKDCIFKSLCEENGQFIPPFCNECIDDREEEILIARLDDFQRRYK